jgi:hypothetical protein
MNPEQLQLHFSSMVRLKEWNDNVARLVDDFGRAERESISQRELSVFSNSTSTDDDIPIVHVERVAGDKHEVHHAVSIRSHVSTRLIISMVYSLTVVPSTRKVAQKTTSYHTISTVFSLLDTTDATILALILVKIPVNTMQPPS